MGGSILLLGELEIEAIVGLVSGYLPNLRD